MPGGELLAEMDHDDAVGKAIRSWCSGTSVVHGLSALRRLPAGKYFVVRSVRAPAPVESLRLGHEEQPVPANVAHLAGEGAGSTLLAFGPDKDRAPCVGRPLVATVAFDVDPVTDRPSVFAFDWSPPILSGLHDGDDLVVVLPYSGPLILDQPERRRWQPFEADLSRWRRFLPGLMAYLVGDSKTLTEARSPEVEAIARALRPE
jgi:hypothetical protein